MLIFQLEKKVKNIEMLKTMTSGEILRDLFTVNYAMLDIYFGELSTFKITQQKTDSFNSLICDTGGNLGLFLGGSLLTIFEIGDLVIVYLCKRNR